MKIKFLLFKFKKSLSPLHDVERGVTFSTDTYYYLVGVAMSFKMLQVVKMNASFAKDNL